MRNFDEARMAAMQAAQQVYGVSEVASGMSARRFEKGVEVTMTRGAFRADPRKMRFGNADR